MSAVTEADGAVTWGKRQQLALEELLDIAVAASRLTQQVGGHFEIDTIKVARFCDVSPDEAVAIADRARVALRRYQASARPTAPGDDVEALRAEVERSRAQVETQRARADEHYAHLLRVIDAKAELHVRATAAEAVLAKARDDALEEAARVAEAPERRGREWVSDSLWDNIRKRTAADIRALTPTDGGPHADR